MTIVHNPPRKTPVLVETPTTDLQHDTELECEPYFVTDLSPSQQDDLRELGLLKEHRFGLLRKEHIFYVSQIWKQSLKPSFVSLDASRPWMIYWNAHSLDLLEEPVPIQSTLETLKACFTYLASDSGGFGGGIGQEPHLATSYAAVLALSILADDPTVVEYLRTIRRPLERWMDSLMTPRGSYRMHDGGEIDVRAVYCVTVLCSLLQLPLPTHAIPFVLQCQTYEGGFGGEPWTEAHGGYTFCAVAALELMDAVDQCDRSNLRAWLVARQMEYEGGFQGRTNKLVDGCYSFWQGGANAILSQREGVLLMDQGMLERYTLLCAQNIHGGLRDKPSKPRDFYHTCYNLSGFAALQTVGTELVYGHPQSKLPPTDPRYNLRIERVQTMLAIQYTD